MKKLDQYSPAVQTLALCHYIKTTPRMMSALLAHFGNLEMILNADAGTLMAIEGMSADLANDISQACDYLEISEKYHTQLNQTDIFVVSRFDKEYPQRLFELNDPPSLLYYRGSLPKEEAKMAALVGTENPTNEGIELTTTIAKELAANGVTLVGSIGTGIPAAGHLGIKSSHGLSYGILNSGLEQIHPEENRPLAIDILKGGGLLTEHPPDKKFELTSFHHSNRIIAGMSQAVIVTEFYLDSAVTVDLLECCMQIGKLVFVMIDPRHGALSDQEALNKAVQYGAIPLVGLEKIDDIIKALV